MKLYLAGIFTSNFHQDSGPYKQLDDREREARDTIEYFLESYHYIHKQSYVEKIRKEGVRVFLDSGAFSAFSRGVEIDLPAYCDYIHRNQDIVASDDGVLCASVLDGIGDPLKTWQNQHAMESLGVKPLPCFHYGEDERYLEWYMSNYEYITLGGMVPISTPQLVHWLDRLWERYLTDGSGRPRIKVHGFGLTSLPLMKRYPWYSVDSSTWVQWGAHGMILIPGVGQVNISSRSSARKIQGQHLATLTDPERQALRDRLTELGFDPDRLADFNYGRWMFNAWAFPEEGRRSVATKFVRPQPELF